MKLETTIDNIHAVVALGVATATSIGWTLPQWASAVSIAYFLILSIDKLLGIWDRFAAKRKKPPELPP
jgi:membrane protein implicated in regulation of membrane protease activity